MHVDKTNLHMSVVMTSESVHGQQKAVWERGSAENGRRRKVDVGVKCMVWELQICIINERGRLLGVTEGSSDQIREVCVCVYTRLLGT